MHAARLVFRLDVRALVQQHFHVLLPMVSPLGGNVQRRLAFLCAATRNRHDGTHASARATMEANVCGAKRQRRAQGALRDALSFPESCSRPCQAAAS